MKKLIPAIFAVLALAALFVTSGCEMKYAEAYPELIQYYCCWGDADKWYDHADPSKTLMTYDATNGVYTIEIETLKKNQRFEITKGASYSIEYCYYNKNTGGTCSQDEANIALFPKTLDNSYGSLQTKLPAIGKYVITFDAATEKYSVAAK